MKQTKLDKLWREVKIAEEALRRGHPKSALRLLRCELAAAKRFFFRQYRKVCADAQRRGIKMRFQFPQ